MMIVTVLMVMMMMMVVDRDANDSVIGHGYGCPSY